MTDVLVLNSLSKTYQRTHALKAVSLKIETGQVFGLLGPNGSGKTTSLGIILGVVRPTSGTYTWFGRKGDGKARRKIGALLEQPSFYPWLSGAANLAVIAAVKRLPSSASDQPLRDIGLWDARHLPFSGYSLGMKQRLAIAAALMGNPEVLVLDEPTNGVDAQGIFEIRSLITKFAQRGGTVILASHMLDEVEKICTHLAILKLGSVLKAGPIGSVLASKGWIELAASDLAAVARAVAELDASARVERLDDMLAVHDTKLTTTVLCGRLAERGITLSHLVQRRPSLESQYLDLVERQEQA